MKAGRPRGFTLLEVVLALGLAFLLLTSLLMAWHSLQEQGVRLRRAMEEQADRALLADRLTLLMRRFCPQTVRVGTRSGPLLRGDERSLVFLSRVSWFSQEEGVHQIRLHLEGARLTLQERGWRQADGAEWLAGPLERSETHVLADLEGHSWSYWIPEQPGLGGAGWVERVDALEEGVLPFWVRLGPPEGTGGEALVFRLGH